MSTKSPNDMDLNEFSEYLAEKHQVTEEYTERLQTIFTKITESNYQAAGAGSYTSLYPRVFTRYDRFGTRYITPNSVYSGYTFITRPRLCLTSENLRTNRFLNMFNTKDPSTVQYAIRLMLDPVLQQMDNDIKQSCYQARFYDPNNPFLGWLTNNVLDITGFPSQHIETFTTEGGFFSEDLRYAIGSDRNKKSFDVNMTFLEPEGGVINALFQVWLTYIDLLTTGELVAYPVDIMHQRLNYTVSIYRFVMDSTNRFIDRFSKCTGCFPVDRPGGAAFDVSRNERFVEAAKNFTIQFSCNKYDENDPIIPIEFNTVVERHCTWINESVAAPLTPEYNYVGIPYIKLDPATKPILEFRYLPATQFENENKNFIKNTEKELMDIQNSYTTKNTDNNNITTPIWV